MYRQGCWTLVLWASFTALATPPKVASAQVPRLAVSSAMECKGCEITAKLTATLGGSDSLQFYGDITVAQNRRGETVVAPLVDHVHAAVFDRRGRLFKTIAGWETQSHIVSLAFDPEDSLYLFDVVAPRMAVLTPAFSIQRRATLPLVVMSASVQSDHQLVVHALPHSPELFGLPLHVIREDALVKSFGNATKTVTVDSQAQLRRVIAVGRDETVWAARVDRYVLENWNIGDGSIRRVVERRAEWFDSAGNWGRPDVIRPGARFAPYKSTTREDSGR